MAENLKTTKYNDGTAILTVTDLFNQWQNRTTPAYYVCNSEYSALYNWYTVNTGKLCPTGWHVPADAEWTTLIDYLGGASVAANKLRETGTAHWLSPNTGATNEVGFTALPGGEIWGSCMEESSSAVWWTSTSVIVTLGLDYGNKVEIVVYQMEDKPFHSAVWRGSTIAYVGMSVRCIKN
jgi:uncharacterized protein (TIGR02145 family)